jgi:2-methylcitrate dehydratase
MSDRTSGLLARYASGCTYDRLPLETVHEVERRTLDSVGVAVAGFDHDAARAARAYAGALAGPEGSIVWGTPDRADVEAAAFANGVMVRCLDFNDTYLSREPLHPSDAIPALVALADRYGRDAPARGRELIASIATAYEVGVRLCDAASLRARGWDHVSYLGIAVACGAGGLLDLDGPRLEHAISIQAVANAAMRRTRAGELSMWKGAAAADAARNAIFAVRIARAGMTGPPAPFEGQMGFVDQLLAGEPLDEAALAPLEAQEQPTAILDTHVKAWPVEHHAQSAVDAALQVRGELGADPSRIEAVRIETFRAAREIVADDPRKWDPTTRETADHSLPYVVCSALQDGEVTARTFDLDRIRRPDTLDLLGRTAVEEDAVLTAGYPDGIPNRVTVMTTDARTIAREVTHPRGHARNPMTDAELGAKYRRNVGERWDAARAARVEDAVWTLHEDGGLARLLEGLRG